MAGRKRWVANWGLGFLLTLATHGQDGKPVTAPGRFAERAELLIEAAPVDKGEWGLLVVDAASGDIL